MATRPSSGATKSAKTATLPTTVKPTAGVGSAKPKKASAKTDATASTQTGTKVDFPSGTSATTTLNAAVPAAPKSAPMKATTGGRSAALGSSNSTSRNQVTMPTSKAAQAPKPLPKASPKTTSAKGKAAAARATGPVETASSNALVMADTVEAQQAAPVATAATVSVMRQDRYEGFGASAEFGAHIFRVEIPVAQSGHITIVEYYGLRGGENGIPVDEPRAVLPRARWSAISEVVRKDFSVRLKAKKLSASRWTTGVNKVDRMLGKELCVLAWAVEHAANSDEAKAIAAKWAALTPEERWWLFSQTVAETGLPEDKDMGWRKALYFALSGGKDKERKPRAPRPVEDMAQGRLI